MGPFQRPAGGAPGRNRTCDPSVRSAVLYPLSYGRDAIQRGALCPKRAPRQHAAAARQRRPPAPSATAASCAPRPKGLHMPSRPSATTTHGRRHDDVRGEGLCEAPRHGGILRDPAQEPLHPLPGLRDQHQQAARHPRGDAQGGQGRRAALRRVLRAQAAARLGVQRHAAARAVLREPRRREAALGVPGASRRSSPRPSAAPPTGRRISAPAARCAASAGSCSTRTATAW